LIKLIFEIITIRLRTSWLKLYESKNGVEERDFEKSFALLSDPIPSNWLYSLIATNILIIL